MMSDLTTRAAFILYVLTEEGPLTTQEIAEKTGMHPRTVRHGNKELLEEEIVMRRQPHSNLRKPVYEPADRLPKQSDRR